jgi:hypothetical protein
MTPTTEELAALLDSTTPGPWEWTEALTRLMGAGGVDVVALDWIGQEDAELVVGAADARLAALAPTLAREVLALRAELAALRALPPVEVPWVETAPGRWESGAGDVVLREPCGGVSHWQSRYPWPTAPIPRAVLLRALERK